ncbi:MAG: SCP2 sterol-binding domain-containing protein [Sphingomonadales bacterium]|jgi:putative sterol carrier protein
MNVNELTIAMAKKLADYSSLSSVVKFNFGDDGVILLVGNNETIKVSNEDIDADCTVNVSLDDFNQIVEGSLDPQMAFMMGKLKVEGDMGIAMQLGKILG